MDESMLDRIQALEDRAEIVQLIARYGPAVDDREFDALGALYTSDAVFDSAGGAIQGREEVIEYYRSRGDYFGATYHYPNSWEIHIDGPKDAHGIVCAHAELSIEGDTHIVALRYHDTYRREEGVWRFQKRDVKLLYVLAESELPTGLAEPDRVRWPGTERGLSHLGPDVG